MIAAILVLVLALAVTACGGLGGGTETTVAASTTAAPTTTAVTEATTTSAGPATTIAVTSTAGSSEATVTTEELSSAETVLPDGNIKAMGYIKEVSGDGGRKIKIDFVEMLTGEEAKQAAIAAGDIGPDEDLPNDYYIRNVNPLIREFGVSASVAITTATRSGGPDEPATWTEFMSWFGGSPPAGTEYLHEMPWWIVRDGNTVVKIDEQYIP